MSLYLMTVKRLFKSNDDSSLQMICFSIHDLHHLSNVDRILHPQRTPFGPKEAFISNCHLMLHPLTFLTKAKPPYTHSVSLRFYCSFFAGPRMWTSKFLVLCFQLCPSSFLKMACTMTVTPHEVYLWPFFIFYSFYFIPVFSFFFLSHLLPLLFQTCFSHA